MKKILLSILLSISSAVLFTTNCFGQATLIYYWDFNHITATDTLNPVYSAPSLSAHFNYYCAYVDTLAGGGSTINLQLGDTAGSCLRFRNPSDSVVFHMPTTYFQNIQFSYAVERTNNGDKNNTVKYSVDGVHFVSTSTVDLVDSSFYTNYFDSFVLHTFNFAADPLTKNNANFAISITFTNGGSDTSGNDRFDNVALKGDVVPGLSVLNQQSAAPTYRLYPNPASNEININASTDDDKSVVVYNVLGQKVYDASATGSRLSINTSGLANGLYYVRIEEKATGMVTTIKFTKQ